MKTESNQMELLRWHHRLGHLYFAKMRYLAITCILPPKLATVVPPKCAGYLYTAMTRVPWRRKGKKMKRLNIATKPGQCVSVDQLESRLLGKIAQLKGKLTNKRYNTATIFIDHFSDFSYVRLQQSTSSEETLEEKRAFEAYAKEKGVSIEHYHADNGRFADNAFINSVKEKYQSISYCGVNAHWQNGRTKKRIRYLAEGDRKQLLHAKVRWSRAITLNVWPCQPNNDHIYIIIVLMYKLKISNMIKLKKTIINRFWSTM